MESFRFIFTFLLVFLSSSTIVCVFGFEHEASALLQFKQSSVFVDVNGSLNSWTNATALCSWAGVICSQPGSQVHGLNLSNMGLVGRLDLSPLMSIANFTDLNLHGNYFYGNLSSTSPTCSFKRVDISSNNFSESIANDFLVHCHHLLSLNLSTNSISGGLFSFPPSLQELDLSSNNFSGLLPLKALTHCTSLRVIDLSSNNLSGQLTTEFGFCKHLPSLSKLILADNFISGGIPSEISDCINLSTIDFSFNDLTGPIPSKIWSLKKLVNLAMSANNLSGEILEDLCTKSASIETLILDHNNLSGVLPASITTCRNLTWVSISNNKLTGQIPMNIGNLKNLAILQLSNNMIIGEVPEDLGNCKSLIWLDLGQNKLSGSIPSSLAAQSGLIVPETLSNLHLVFVQNYADGIKCPGPLLFIHSKRIPKRLANFLLLSSCQSTGIYTDTTLYPFETNGSMIYIDLSYNSLTGSIPEEFGKMDHLQALNLDGNMLTGNIPDSFGRLKMIEILHLSRNQLTGGIPGVLGALSFLSDFDVSNNNLTGVIPTAGQLLTFGPARYANNSGLCGVPLGPCGSGGSDEEKPETTGADNSVSKGDILIMFITFVSGFITAISIASIVQGVISTCFKGGKNERRAQSRQRRP